MAKRHDAQLTFRAVKQADAAAREARRRRGGRPRKPAAERGVPHAARPVHEERHPVHVTLRLVAGLPSLRDRKVFPIVRRALLAASVRFRQMFRIVEYSVQSNHLHLVIEATDRRELSRGMQGFGIRLAKNLNLRLERRGAVLRERYHAHALRTPTETRRALEYVRQNTHLHRWRQGQRASWSPDPCSSEPEAARAKLPPAESYLLRRARTAFS